MKPPRNIPNELRDQFTMGNKIPIIDNYIDGCSEDALTSTNNLFTMQNFNEHLEKAKKKQQGYYNITDAFLYQVLDQPACSITNMDVGIIGSANPWYEALVSVYEPKSITVLEYNKVPDFHPDITYIHPDDAEEDMFDFCLSISSFEHSGLGRYGDPIDPDGDLKAMTHAKSYVKPKGVMFLAVPVGKDCIHWNAHRIYGQLRLPKLLQYWKAIYTAGYSEDMAQQFDPLRADYQPIFVLENDK